MKITKRQLLKIIREEVITKEYPEAEYTIDLMLDKENPDEVEAEEDAWAGGTNLVNPVDFEAVTGLEVPPKGIQISKLVGENRVKITKRQLRRIIREENRKVLLEQEEVIKRVDIKYGFDGWSINAAKELARDLQAKHGLRIETHGWDTSLSPDAENSGDLSYIGTEAQLRSILADHFPDDPQQQEERLASATME